jgi:hypothetical protein
MAGIVPNEGRAALLQGSCESLKFMSAIKRLASTSGRQQKARPCPTACQLIHARLQEAAKCRSLGAGAVEVETTDLMDDEAVDRLCAVQLKVSNSGVTLTQDLSSDF